MSLFNVFSWSEGILLMDIYDGLYFVIYILIFLSSMLYLGLRRVVYIIFFFFLLLLIISKLFYDKRYLELKDQTNWVYIADHEFDYISKLSITIKEKEPKYNIVDVKDKEIFNKYELEDLIDQVMYLTKIKVTNNSFYSMEKFYQQIVEKNTILKDINFKMQKKYVEFYILNRNDLNKLIKVLKDLSYDYAIL